MVNKFILSIMLSATILTGCGSNTLSFEYEIHKVDKEGIYGHHETDKENNIFLVPQEIKENIKQGDKILVTFDKDNTIDGIIHVKKIN